MIKKSLGFLIISLVILSSLTASAVDTFQKPEGVSNAVRILDGIGEIVDNWILKMSFNQSYKNCKAVYPIPELDNGYVPQGFCYVDELNCFAVSAYKAKENSIISLIDAESGNVIKTVKLSYPDGTACKSHAGGVADINGFLFVSTGQSMNRVKISDITNAENYDTISFCGGINADMQASNACSFGNYLFIGKFYSFTPTGTYDSVPSQWVTAPGGKRYYAMCEIFDLTDMEKVIADGSAVPIAALTLPNSVQGIAYDGKYFYTSSSSSFFGYSAVKKFALNDFTSNYCIDLGKNTVPLVMMTDDKCVSEIKLPPMIEGIDMCNNSVFGIFESGAEKFPIVSKRTSDICQFSF